MTEENAVVQELDKTEPKVNAEVSDATSVDPRAIADQGEHETEEKKRKGGWQRRQEKAERERDYWREVALKNAPKTAEVKTEPAKAKPSWSEYESSGKQEQYFEDLADWKAEQKLAAYKSEQQAEAKKRETQTEQEKQAERWKTSSDEFRKEHPDLDEVIAQGNPSDLLSSLVARSKEPVRLAYHLANNPELESRLSRINDPVEVAQELGEIRAQLAKPEPAAEEREIPPIPTAPPPITPVRKVTPGTEKGLSDDLPMKEWSKRYTAQMEKAKKK